jgi:hypothetical protein
VLKSFQINEKIDAKPCNLCSGSHSIEINLIIVIFFNLELDFVVVHIHAGCFAQQVLTAG